MDDDKEDRLWALQEAAKPSGLTPHAASVKSFIAGLAMEGLLHQSDVAPVWYITDCGRAELERLA